LADLSALAINSKGSLDTMGIKTNSKMLISTLAISICIAGTANSADRILKVTNWAEYIGEETIANFEAEYGKSHL